MGARLAVGVAFVPLFVARAALAQDGEAEAPEPPRLSLGARAGFQHVFLEGDGAPPDLRGTVFGADAAYRITPNLGVAAVGEVAMYDQRSDRLPPGPIAQSFAAFVEARLDTNPLGPWSCRIDLGAGHRWLVLPFTGDGTDRYTAIEPLRLRVGPTWRATDGFDVSIVGGAGFGWFASYGSTRACSVTATCADSRFDSDTQSSAHFVVDLSIAVRGWPGAGR